MIFGDVPETGGYTEVMDAEHRPGVATESTGESGGAAARVGVNGPVSGDRIEGFPGRSMSDSGDNLDREAAPDLRSVGPAAGAVPPIARSDPDLRLGYVFSLGLGCLFAALGVYLAARTLPRYAEVQARYHFSLPPESRWVLGSGWLQPVPGCLLILAGLTGLLAKTPGRRQALATVAIVLLALALVAATGAALLIPELTLV